MDTSMWKDRLDEIRSDRGAMQSLLNQYKSSYLEISGMGKAAQDVLNNIDRLYINLHTAVTCLDMDDGGSNQAKECLLSALESEKEIVRLSGSIDEEFKTAVMEDLFGYAQLINDMICGSFDFNIDKDLYQTEKDTLTEIIEEMEQEQWKDAFRMLLATTLQKLDPDDEDLALECAMYDILSMGVRDKDLYMTEAYIGKTQNLLEGERILDEIIKLVKENPTVDLTNHPLNKKLEKCFEKEFGVKAVYIAWWRVDWKQAIVKKPSDDPLVLSDQITSLTGKPNAYTIPNVEMLIRGTKNLSRMMKKKNERYYDESHKDVIMITLSASLLINLDVTGGEVMGCILHEIGHNFDFSPYTYAHYIIMLLDIKDYLKLFNRDKGLIKIYGALNDSFQKYVRDLVFGTYQTLVAAFEISSNLSTTVLGKLDKAFTKLGSKVPGFNAILNLADKITYYSSDIIHIIDLYQRNAISYVKGLIREFQDYRSDSIMRWTKMILSKKREIFADSFCATYGYSVEFTSLLAKFQEAEYPVLKKMSEKYPVTSIFLDLGIASNRIIMMLINPSHGLDDERASKMLKHLKTQLRTVELTPEMRKELEEEVDNLQEIVDGYVSTSADERLYLTAATQWIIIKIFRGNSFLLEKIFPDVRA